MKLKEIMALAKRVLYCLALVLVIAGCNEYEEPENDKNKEQKQEEVEVPEKPETPEKPEVPEEPGDEEVLPTEIDPKWNQFIIQAHRGKLNTHPENSWIAFLAAAETGFNCIETDIHWTKDNVPILLHDEEIDRISNGTGMPGDMTLAEMQSYSYHCPLQFGEKYFPTPLLTAEEYLLKCKERNFLCELDMAGRVQDIEKLNDVVRLVKKCGMLQTTMIKLIPEDIERMDKSIPIFVGVSTAMTPRNKDQVIEKAAEYKKWALKVAISLKNDDVTKSRISRIHELGMFAQSWVYIQAWDTAEKMEQFKQMGLDIYMTDDLDIMTKYKSYLRRKGRQMMMYSKR